MIQRPASLLCVDEIHRDLARVRHRLAHGALGDLVKDDAMHGLAVEHVARLQLVRDVPGNRLALAVRVRCKDERVRLLHRARQGADAFLLVFDDRVVHLEVTVRLDRAGL